MGCNIHDTAIVDPTAELGVDVEIGPYSIVGANSKIGDGCFLASHVVVDKNTTLGSANKIFQFASVGADPQDLKFAGEKTELIVGDGNSIREFVTIHRGTAQGGGLTKIGNGNLFMATSHVAHDCMIGDNNIFANSVSLAGHVVVDNHATLGGLAGVHQFSRIGSYAFLGAGSMVRYNFPPYCLGQGDRCQVRGINIIGLQRAGFSSEEISEIRKAYRAVFAVPGKMKEKVADYLADKNLLPSVQVFFDFINESDHLSSPAKSLSSK
ncbi:acyl-[acyl-carrier-protein]--UDP-N-acetylglucosamine O-acyltransferase [bacterium J17]|nr:acyl-[acyl-carrier-protein]--UDP-N-acetylglucosamine O-acyltransferase [bacterium J17]